MSWEKSNYTAAGAALLSESLSGGALVITRAVSGTGTADADLSEETGVSGETHDLKLLDIETVESNGETARRVKIQITRCGRGSMNESAMASANSRPERAMRRVFS